METVTGYVLCGVGAVLFGVGYFRRSRNLMLLGTLMLFVGAGFRSLVKGAMEGWKAAG